MKKHVAVVTGGDSGEYEISVQSGEVVFQHLDREAFIPWKVLIHGARWEVETESGLIPVDKNDFSFEVNGERIKPEGVFMVIHGTPGENGKLQGYFDILDIPYSTCGVTSAALTFNKGYCNAVLQKAGFRVARSVISHRHAPLSAAEVLEKVSLPAFVKPNNGGSSIGISRVNEASALDAAMQKAFEVDAEILIEEFVSGTEVTCGVANVYGRPQALAITEIVFESEFFDYHAKYHDPKTQEITPARIPEHTYERIMGISEQVFKELNCRGMIRIDYIIQEGEPFLIEVNTIPGLTAKSLIPQQAEYNGISRKQLFSGIMQNTLDRK